MADISETQDSAAHHQNSKKTSAGSRSLKQTKKRNTWSSAKCGLPSANTPGGRTAGVINSNGSVKPGGQVKLPKPKVDLKAFFDYYFVRKQHKKRKKRRLRGKAATKPRTKKKTPEGEQPKIPLCQRKRRLGIPARERRREARERGLPFPFVEKLCGRKHIPFKLVCRYEQLAVQGYFRYIETLKYEHHLKKSLGKLNAGDDLENESLESRKYKYLDDDDGPLSPIEDPVEEDQNTNSGNDDIGARIVEKSSFILSSTISEEKKKYKKKTKSFKNECTL